MKNGWTELDHYTKMIDGITCMAFTISFLPNTGNKYFLAATDGDVSIFDFEKSQVSFFFFFFFFFFIFLFFIFFFFFFFFLYFFFYLYFYYYIYLFINIIYIK